jgi:hypothetical protein
MEHISKILLKKYEKLYLQQQSEKILDFARQMYNIWEITLEQLQDTYFYQFKI